MSDRPKKSTKKKPLDSVILVNRKEFLSALGLTSAVLQAMGEEFESLRTAGHLNPEIRKALMQMLNGHLKNVAHVSHAFTLSMYDPIDPDGTRGRDLN